MGPPLKFINMTPSQVARKYLGQKEIPGNKFVDDPNVQKDLGELLHKAGQKDGEAWCCYLAEAVFCEAYPLIEKELRKLFSASAVQTAKNFEAAGYEVSDKPFPNALVIWQRYVAGKKSWQGHAGVVDDQSPMTDTTWKSVEGNTNVAGERETNEGVVALQPRKKAYPPTGLHVLCFIKIPK